MRGTGRAGGATPSCTPTLKRAFRHAHHQRSGLARDPGRRRHALVGHRLNHYEIVAPLGCGGMGEVYQARDLKLGRQVALKLLPSGWARDERRRRRLEREARAVAALNHPGIVTLYSLETGLAGDGQEVPFLVMELVEGERLADLTPPGGLPLPRFLDLALPIADAVAAAHAQGIVHRDLKPQNVMVTAEGQVKVLDFGLAKLLEDPEDRDPPAASSQAATPSSSLTRTGHALGTPGYMSPEQLEGGECDPRSDVFALGVLFYQLIAGRRPWAGHTPQAVAASTLRDEPPPLLEVRPGLPPELDGLLRRCLEKDPDRRYPDARVLRAALVRLRGSGPVPGREATLTAPVEPPMGVSAPGRPIRPRFPHGARVALATALAGASLTLATLRILSAWRFTHGHTPPEHREWLPDPPVAGRPCPSLDGRSIVYASEAEDRSDLYLLPVEGGTPRKLSGALPGGGSEPALSRDSRRLAFRSEAEGGGLHVMDLPGGPVRRVAGFGHDPDWSPDGQALVFTSSGAGTSSPGEPNALWRVPSDGRSQPERLAVASAFSPRWSPGGKRIAVWVQQGQQTDIWTLAADGGDWFPVTADPVADSLPAWSRDGRWLYFVSHRSGSPDVWRVPFDEARGRPTGGASLVSRGPQGEVLGLEVLPDDSSVLLSFTRPVSRLWRLDLTQAAAASGPPALLVDGCQVRSVDPSPDATRLVFHARDGAEDLWVSSSDLSGLRHLTEDPERDRYPRWSPDASLVAFTSRRGGAWELWTLGAEGQGLAPVPGTALGASGPVWSPDGGRLAFWASEEERAFLVGRDGSALEPLPAPPEGIPGFVPSSWSPDGRRIAGTSRTRSRRTREVVILDLAEGSYRVVRRGERPVWLGDTGTLALIDPGGRIVLLDTRSGKETVLGEPAGASYLAATRDGRSLYCVSRSEAAGLRLQGV